MLHTESHADDHPAEEDRSQEVSASRSTALRIMAENMQAARSRLTDMDVLYSLETLVTEKLMPQQAVSRLVQPTSLPDLAFRLLD